MLTLTFVADAEKKKDHNWKHRKKWKVEWKVETEKTFQLSSSFSPFEIEVSANNLIMID